MFGFLFNKRKAIEQLLPELDTTDLAAWLSATRRIEAIGNRAVAPLCDLLREDLNTSRSPSVVATKRNDVSADKARELFEKATNGINAGKASVLRNCALKQGIFVGDNGVAEKVRARVAVITANRSCKYVYSTYIFVGCALVPEARQGQQVLETPGDPVNLIAFGCNRQWGIIQCLTNLRSVKSLDALIAAADAQNEWVREYAFTAINTLGAEACLDKLLRLFTESGYDDVPLYCISVIRQLKSSSAQGTLKSLAGKARTKEQGEAIKEALAES